MNRGLILRIGAAVSILVSGIVHLDLYYNAGYRAAGDGPNFGRSILLNAIASGIIATALVARREWFVRAAGIGFALSTTAIFFFHHSGNSLFGQPYSGPIFEPSPQAQIALVAQIVAVALLAATFVPAVAAEDARPVPLAAIGGAFAVSAIALIALALKWDSDEAETVAAAPSAVAITGFKFVAPDLSIPAGTTVTWTNGDGVSHSVVAEDTSFVSDNLGQGATFDFTFETPGTYPYICGIHTNMKGTVTVTG